MKKAFVLLFGLSFVSGFANLKAEQTIPPYNPPKVYTPTHMMAFTQRCALWRTDATFESVIQLSNQLATAPIDATVTLYMADGTPYPLPPVHLEKSGVAKVNINSALAEASAEILPHLSQFGSASITYKYEWQGVVFARMSILDAPRSLQYSYPFMFPMDAMAAVQSEAMKPKSTVEEGLIWKYSPSSRTFVALANTTNREIHVSLGILDQDGLEEQHRQLSVAPMSTALEMVERSRERFEDARGESVGGLRIAFDGDSDSLQILGGIEDAAHGYSANVPIGTVSIRDKVATVNFATTGMMIGKQDPMMGFPANLRFHPYAYFRNMSDRPAQLSGQVYYDVNGETKSAPVPALWLGPHQSRKLPLREALDGLKVDGSVTLSFSYTGPQSGLLAETGSVDETGTYVFETLPRILGESASKSSIYWTAASGFDTMYSLWNPGEQAEDLLLTFHFGANQTYRYPVHLAAKAQAMADVKMIIDMAMPDSSGHVLPSSATEGSLLITAASGGVKDVIQLVVDSGIYNPATATCGYGCETCNGCTNYLVQADPFDAVVSIAQQAYAQCVWENGSLQNYTPSAQWSSDTTSVITVETTGQSNPGLTNPLSGGGATLSAAFSAPVNMGQICATMPLPSCEYANLYSSAPANVNPTLSISPRLWFFGLGNAVSGYSTQATVTANSASGGSFAWSITSGAAKVSFASMPGTASITTSGNTVTVYATGFSTAMNDVTISLTWTPAGKSAFPAVTINTDVDSPYKLVQTGYIPPSAVGDCTHHSPGPVVLGWWSRYTWAMISFFSSNIPGAPINEAFDNLQDAQPNNWTFTPNGSAGKPGVNTFIDDYCFANQIAARPKTEPPQNPLGTSLVDSATQYYSVGSTEIGIGVSVQYQTLQRFVDHPALQGITSPVR